LTDEGNPSRKDYPQEKPLPDKHYQTRSSEGFIPNKTLLKEAHIIVEGGEVARQQDGHLAQSEKKTSMIVEKNADFHHRQFGGGRRGAVRPPSENDAYIPHASSKKESCTADIGKGMAIAFKRERHRDDTGYSTIAADVKEDRLKGEQNVSRAERQVIHQEALPAV